MFHLLELDNLELLHDLQSEHLLVGVSSQAHLLNPPESADA